MMENQPTAISPCRGPCWPDRGSALRRQVPAGRIHTICQQGKQNDLALMTGATNGGGNVPVASGDDDAPRSEGRRRIVPGSARSMATAVDGWPRGCRGCCLVDREKPPNGQTSVTTARGQLPVEPICCGIIVCTQIGQLDAILLRLQGIGRFGPMPAASIATLTATHNKRSDDAISCDSAGPGAGAGRPWSVRGRYSPV